ncbi:MAG TPA: radical SAM protein, partial [Acidobacteriota bacterium]|nr:radical SAM protein [Acidobacteriota bacterium]
RDELITDERRMRQRYTLSHMAFDVKAQTGMTEPLRDWFPLSLMGAFADFADLAHGPGAEWGQVSCGCHPNCGVGTAIMVDKETGDARPVPEFLDIPGLVADTRKLTDAARGKWVTNFMMGLALLKHYKPFRSPSRLTLLDVLKKFDKSFGLSGRDYGKNYGDDAKQRRKDPWNFLFIAGMWFQDLFNYDFRRTEMCIIPYGTQEGEISFCAYNTGHGWRNIIEHMHMNATVAKWYEGHGRHEIFAGGKNVDLNSYEHSLQLNSEDVSRHREKTDKPQTARDEKLLRRKAAREASMVREYYEETVLKKKNQRSDLVDLSIT